MYENNTIKIRTETLSVDKGLKQELKTWKPTQKQ